MSKRNSKALASAIIMSLVLTSTLSTSSVQASMGRVTRTSGADRYATAAQVAITNWPTGANDVILVSGEGYADAVSASVLAKQLKAPILLTKSSYLSVDAMSALTTLRPKNVYIVGGYASISQSIRDSLRYNYNLVELQGSNRYETNIAVARKLVELGVNPTNMLLVGGQGFSDALSVAPVAAAKGQILLLGNNNEDSMAPIVSFVKANNSKVTVVGTSNVISDNMYYKLGAIERVNGGGNRFETNINVLNRFTGDLKADKLYVANASGDGYADALVASALAGKTASPLILVDTTGSSATNTAINYIRGKATKNTDLNVIGGSSVVSDYTVSAINNAVNPGINPGGSTKNGDNTVSDIIPINLNQFDVVFNTDVDEDTAELLSNYKVAGTKLNNSNAHAELINDNTVRITLVKAEFTLNQGIEKTVSVKKGILTENKAQTIESYNKKIEFKDIIAPTLKNVSIRGNNKLVIEFSEAVNMSSLSKVASLIRIDDKNLSNYNSTYSQIKEAATNGSETWASKIEFYLSSGLKSGEHKVKVEKGKNGVLIDAAAFSFKEEEQTITVDNITSKPQIEDITCTDDGELRIKFDRQMDTKTSLVSSYYTINDKKIDGAKLEFQDDDYTIKVTKISSDILRDDANILEIQDNVKDAYGNKIEDETRKSFDKEKDKTKPTVLSATIIDDRTIRVQFSEDVKYSYATNKDNYKLKDSDDLNVMGKSGVYIEASSEVDDKDREDTDTYDIKFDRTSYRLDSSRYTLTVEKIIDKATEPNRMKEQTVDVDGDGSSAPSIDDIEAFRKSSTEVAIYFGKEMDSSSLIDKSNYYYINGNGESEELPDDVDISQSSDHRGVVLDFDDTNKIIYATSGAPKGEDVVKKIGAKTLKDVSGNDVFVGALTIAGDSSSGPELEENSFKLYKDDDDVKAEFHVSTSINKVNRLDFNISGVSPDNVDYDGRKIILTFNEGTSADAVMALGASAKLQINPVSSNPSEDIGGRHIESGSQLLYYNEIAPETDRDNYSAAVTIDGATNKIVSAVANVTLKTKVDATMLPAYKDDFVFTNARNGKRLDVSDVKLNGTTLVFTIENAETKISTGDKIYISTSNEDIDLRAEKDGNGKQIKYVPTSNDLRDKLVEVTSIISINKTVLNNSISSASALNSANYTSATWANVQTKLEAATKVAANSSATQVEINTAQTELNAAVANLVSIAELNTSIATVKGLNSSNYTSATWVAVQTKLTAATILLTNANTTQTDVNAAKAELDIAIKNLVNISALNNSIVSVSGLNSSNYTKGTWTSIQNKLALATAVAVNASATQNVVDTAKAELDTAIANLVSIVELKSSIASAHTSIDGKTAANFTDATTYNAVVAKLIEAETIVSNANATQLEVNTVKTELDTALTSLH